MNQTIDKSRIYTYIASVAAFLQLSVPQWHLPDIDTQIVSAILLAIVSVFTILKQRVSIEISNKATIVTWILIGIAVLGGANQLIDKVQISDQWQNILRSSIAALIGLLNLSSKSLFSTDAGEIIQQTKAEIKENTIIPLASTD